ncbi:sec-independent protein translocase protein TatA [Streptosporangium album]|uniref:Sec-independent protein translocase protein TatA n=1 Tax=Streptosporangium album TaxID=47479 RepID=A0A7W7S015_9ACTN|nr:Sec-independent protein translocase subunit TatA [Streptosporangium album]MBB4941409.1 sec-independent protein translocase protein TatA [Streptosporangium album]
MADLGMPELLIILAVFILLFGAKKLPDTARSLGRSLRVFKAEISRPDDEQPPPAPPAPPAPHP